MLKLFASQIGLFIDKKNSEQKMIDIKERLENVIEGANIGTWEWNVVTGETIYNEKWAEMIGYKLEELSPTSFRTWKILTHPIDVVKSEKELRKVMNKEIEYYDFELRMKHKNGKWIWMQDRGKVTKWSSDGKPILISGTIMDITEKKEKQKKIEYLSFHDHLTGLYNKRYMEDSIERLDTSRSLPFSIIVLDVNGLKLTNDAYGHEMGDELLKAVAKILKNSCRNEDIACRVGGDEFVILLPNVDEKRIKNIIERIREESENTKLDSVIVSLAIGYSTKNRKDKDISEVYKEADNEMYKNKLKYGRIMKNKTIEKVLANVKNKYDNEKIHTERVSQYSSSIARAMNLSDKEIQDAKIAGSLHDIGKIIVPPEILNKKDKLTEYDWETIKKHAITSYQLLKNVDKYVNISKPVLYHHEKLDGSGYPEGLKENEIPLLSKIIAVADAYEAMTANRPYHKKKTKEEAVEELKRCSGTQFDKDIVEIFTDKVL